MPTKTLFSFPITLIVFLLPILGLFAESLALMPFKADSISVMISAQGFLQVMNLKYFILSDFEYHNDLNNLSLNYLNIFFYLIFLLGAVIYVWSGKRESRLIRFMLAIVFLQSLLHFISGILSNLYYIDLVLKNNWFLTVLAFACKNAFLAYLAYDLLGQLQASKALDAEYRSIEEEEVFIPNEASKWQRLFHWIIDAYICLFLFSSYSYLLGPVFLDKIEAQGGERIAIFSFLLLVQPFYYFLFEFLLNATPGKLLAETRIVSADGQKPGIGTILGRTFARYIPFDQVSFLFMEGWHDRLSSSSVVREVRTGVKGSRYLLIIPAVLLLLILGIIAYDKYEDRKFFLSLKSLHDSEVAIIEQGLQGLSTAQIIKIEEVSEYSRELPIANPQPVEESYMESVEIPDYNEEADVYSGNLYLKIEDISKDSISACLIINPPSSSLTHTSLIDIERFYLQNKASSPQFKIAIHDLKNAYTKDFKGYGQKSKAQRLLGGRNYYQIKTIARLFEPNLVIGSGFIQGNTISIELENYGWPAQLVKIVNLQDKVKWSNRLPENIPSIYPSLYLNGDDYINKSSYKVKLVVLDSTQREHHFLLQGNDLNNNIQKIK